jgi:phosphoserine phosphatase
LQEIQVPHVLVLVSAAQDRALTAAHLRACLEVVGQDVSPVWLGEEISAEIGLPDAVAGDVTLPARLKAALGGAPIDLATVPALDRRKRLFLADMDSTLIEQECIDELAAHIGMRAEVSAITERAMRGEIAFEPALRERVGLLEGLPVGVADELLASRITLSAGARQLVQTMRQNGAYCCLVSGGFTLFTGKIAERLGFHEHRANRLRVRDGRLTGEVEEPILGRDAKLAALIELRQSFGLPREAVLAVGDGANDLAMLGEAGLGVAYRAKPAVAAAAQARIDHGDLSALLYLQGYRRNEFVE